MLPNILKARVTRLKFAAFITYFLLVLSSGAIFANDVDRATNKRDSIKDTIVSSAITNNTEDTKRIENIKHIENTENIKNTKTAKGNVNNKSAEVDIDSVSINNQTTTATEVTTATNIKDTKIPERPKNPSVLKEATQGGVNQINSIAGTDHKVSTDSKIEETKEIKEAKKAKIIEEAKIAEEAKAVVAAAEEGKIEETKKTNLTKEGRRTAMDADPLSKTIKIANARDGVMEKFFADNEQINVILSNRDINRVLVSGDKIQSINGPAGLYTAKNDAIGSGYISLYGDTTFTIFVSTVKGHNFSLLVSPRSVAGRTIILTPTTPSVLTSRFEETENYQKVLVTLITSMINNEAIEDYAYSEAKGSKKIPFYGIADIKPIAFYSGSHLVGIISELKNRSKAPIILKPSYFYKPGVRAVALSCQTIAPSEIGLLYQVISRE